MSEETERVGGADLGLMPNRPRQGGYGPLTDGPWSRRPYRHPAAGWGATRSVTEIFLREREPIAGTTAMLVMNHANTGYDCPGCAWPDATGPLRLDICENGIKHVTWEMTHKRVDRDFFAAHTVTELSEWSDFALEDQGRLTEPMTYDAESDRYLPVSWDDAFSLIGAELRALDSPDEASFYTSGRLSNEATFLYQLMVREYGTNNLPDCSNMCHEASGRALKASIATGKGTADLVDWEECDALFLLGSNAASNAPRMLTALADAVRRGAQVVHVNPLVEAGATRAIVPHEFVDMALNRATATSTMNLQVRPGGDLALIRGMAKAVLEVAQTDPGAVDEEFLATYTNGFETYRDLVEGTPWAELVRQSGLSQQEIRAAADVYLTSGRTVISWCLGISQHEHGVDTVREIVNLLLLRGNIGRPGTGPSPVRGHSNVQGNRTCGVDHNPTQEWLDRLAAACLIDPPRHRGLDTVHTIEAMHDGRVKVFLGMGGNFVLAAPDTVFTAEGLRRCRLTVQVSTKLNRSHLVHGAKALILPCLGRTERDEQEGGVQGVTVEDAMSMVHLSVGRKRPASSHLRSEPAIIAGIAKATLPDTRTPWDWYVGDYDRIRDVMSRALRGFEGFNQVVRRKYGFRIPQPARARVRDAVGQGRVLSRVAAGRHPGVAGHARAADHALARPVEHHDLLRQRSLPRRQEPPRARVPQCRGHARARHRRGRPRRHRGHLQGRLAALRARLPGDRLRPAARGGRRVHAGAQRAGRAQGLQHPERPAAHEEHPGDRDPALAVVGLTPPSPYPRADFVSHPLRVRTRAPPTSYVQSIGASRSNACRTARASCVSWCGERKPTVRPSADDGMVTTLSTATAHSWSRPFAGPTGTSLPSPFTVVVMGATVTFVIAPRAASRVSTRTGRVLSRCARAISRIVHHGAEARRGPQHQVIEVIRRALLDEDLGVELGCAAPELALDRYRDELGPALRAPATDDLVESDDEIVRETNGDLSAHGSTIP